jgi:hypothetical protein
MKKTINDIDSAIAEVFKNPNDVLSVKFGRNYNTIASWRFNINNGTMSTEKKEEILGTFGYKLIQKSTWKKSVK